MRIIASRSFRKTIRRFEFTRPPLAEVEAHPGDTRKLGLRNLSQATWTTTKKDGDKRSVEPGRLFPLVPGRAIDFGSMSGTVRG